MKQVIAIGYERDSDRDEIRALLTAAFPTATEADLVERLRENGDILLALVARDAAGIAGYLAFSQMRAPFVAVALAPLAVRADQRKQGIAASLMDSALGELRAIGVEAVFVVGDPAYYQRLGFDARAASRFDTPFAGPHFMVRTLTSAPLAVTTGPVEYAPAFATFE